MIAFCQNMRRRDLVLQTPNLNGIDYLEALGNPGCGKQLALTFLKDATGLNLQPQNILISGGAVVTVSAIAPPTVVDPLTVTIDLDRTGDFSRYTLVLVGGANDPTPPAGIDSQLASVDFSFKAGCPTPVDCLVPDCCPETALTPPDIHYLARDYDGFRQAMIDRMAVLLPTWSETHAADIGITLIETLAYAADRVSYFQDAVNTEAYIATARSRISLRRHARLVDYPIGEGANARVLVSFAAAQDNVLIPRHSHIYPLVPGLRASVAPDSYDATLLAASAGPIFATMAPIVLQTEQNEMSFYTWGNGQCCLPTGATSASLTGTVSSLTVGQFVIFEEIMGPLTGDPADADPARRCAVRLTAVTALTDPTMQPPTPVTDIAWDAADALPFPLCLSSVTDADHGLRPLPAVSVARGNTVAADQGQWTHNEPLGVVPAAPVAPVDGIGCNCATVPGAAAVRPRFAPILAQQPLTFAAPYDPTATATAFLIADPATASPQIGLRSDDGSQWLPTADLLEDNDSACHFIPEIEWDGSAHLRFGDGVYGRAPEQGMAFTADYRTGNGTAGNIGRDTLAHVLLAGAGVLGLRNPLAAAGGVDPETMQHIRQFAPFSFQTQLRCVTAADYGAMAALVPGVQQARGTLRWTGSWYSAFASIDPVSNWTAALRHSVTTALDGLRMMGVDAVVEQAKFVGLKIILTICVGPGFFRGDVYAALWQLLVTGDACLGIPGLLSADNFAFGATVYSSPIVAAAQSVAGVVSVRLSELARMDAPPAAGATPPPLLTMGATEIPCCANDPNHLDHGSLILVMEGGK